MPYTGGPLLICRGVFYCPFPVLRDMYIHLTRATVAQLPPALSTVTRCQAGSPEATGCT